MAARAGDEVGGEAARSTGEGGAAPFLDTYIKIKFSTA